MLDWTFKFVFGPSGKYKEGLISLLNAIIPDRKIKSIEYLPTEMLGEVSVQRKSIMDLRCVAEDGTQFVVEVQNYKEDGFFERCIAYACKLFLEQNRKGVEYKDLLPVYVVAILSEKASKEMVMYRECKNQVIYDHTIIEKFSGIFAPRTISVSLLTQENLRRTFWNVLMISTGGCSCSDIQKESESILTPFSPKSFAESWKYWKSAVSHRRNSICTTQKKNRRKFARRRMTLSEESEKRKGLLKEKLKEKPKSPEIC